METQRFILHFSVDHMCIVV